MHQQKQTAMKKYKQNLRIIGSQVMSYETHVATIDITTKTLVVNGHWSATTTKHINYVASELGLLSLTKKSNKQGIETYPIAYLKPTQIQK